MCAWARECCGFKYQNNKRTHSYRATIYFAILSFGTSARSAKEAYANARCDGKAIESYHGLGMWIGYLVGRVLQVHTVAPTLGIPEKDPQFYLCHRYRVHSCVSSPGNLQGRRPKHADSILPRCCHLVVACWKARSGTWRLKCRLDPM